MMDGKCIVASGWKKCGEFLGLALLIIATVLTIFTASSLGIAAMFIVGGMLCCRHCWSCRCCRSTDAECCAPDATCETKEKKPSTKKAG